VRRLWDRSAEPLVLCYHAISDDWSTEISTTTSQLRDQLELLVERGFRGATFTDVVTSPGSESTGSARTVAVTFDDAFSSVLERAYPILSSLGFPATVFVVTEFAETGGPLHWAGIDKWVAGDHAEELQSLTWAELQRLADAGWEIGSHTCTHPRLTQLADDALDQELRGSRDACESALGRSCRALAYPYGDVDFRVAAAAADVGYEAAATVSVGVTGPTALAWPRVGVYHADSLRRFRIKTSPVVRRLRKRLFPIEARLRLRGKTDGSLDLRAD
jgi:peptidoglycan/xylan/chitin deacetylase (PgdA/CDA1 family)